MTLSSKPPAHGIDFRRNRVVVAAGCQMVGAAVLDGTAPLDPGSRYTWIHTPFLTFEIPVPSLLQALH